MQVAVTFRHLEPSEAIKVYAQEKLEKIKKYFPNPISAHAVLSVGHRNAHVADIQISLHNGILLKAVETTEDMHSSIDLVVAKIERQIRKYKDRIHDHHPHKGPKREMRHRLVDSDVMEQEDTSKSSPKVFKEEKYVSHPLTVEQAIMQMNLRHEPLLCFHNALTHEVNVVYIRPDGSYALIEATHEESSSH